LASPASDADNEYAIIDSPIVRLILKAANGEDVGDITIPLWLSRQALCE
jgi:hypothetical protein